MVEKSEWQKQKGNVNRDSSQFLTQFLNKERRKSTVVSNFFSFDSSKDFSISILLRTLGLTQWNLNSFEFKLDDARLSS